MVARPSASRSRPFAAAIHELAARTDAAVLLDLEGTVLFANDAWERYAVASGAPAQATVGASLVEAVQGEEPRRVLREVLARAARSPGRTAITVEWNSPDTARLLAVQLAPVLAGSEPIGVTIVQRIVRALPVGEVYPVVEAAADDYRRDGKLEQCTCCRRTRRPADPAEWDFVPALVAAPPPDAILGYCPLCRQLHWPLGADGAD